MPKISIVTVSLNCLHALAKTVASVVGQTFENIEYVIIDGGSTDGTLEFLQGLSGNIKWISEPDSGIYNAMNKGVRAASGEWICFMNAGDTFYNNGVCKQIFESEHAEADVVYGNVERNGRLIVAKQARAIHRMPFCHQSCFVRTELLRKTPFDESYRLSGDFKFFRRIMQDGARFERLPMPVCIFDTGGLTSLNREEALLENIRVVKEFDKGLDRLCHLLRLRLQIFMCKIRPKKNSR